MQLNNIVIISGPSGAGEDSVIAGLSEFTTVNRVITTTTREPREGESEGNPYHFISHDEFQAKIADNAFVEWAEQYNNQFYGVTEDELQRVNSMEGLGIWKLDYKGAASAKKLFPEMTAILLSAESLDVLEERIRSRDNASEQFVAERMEYTKEWLKHVDAYDYTVVNKQGMLEATIQEVIDILRKEQYL